jgi:hypothetical protein
MVLEVSVELSLYMGTYQVGKANGRQGIMLVKRTSHPLG